MVEMALYAYSLAISLSQKGGESLFLLYYQLELIFLQPYEPLQLSYNQ